VINVSVGECLGKGWEGLKRHPGTAIGGYFLYCLISGAGWSIPYLNILFFIFVAAPLGGGLVIFFLRLAKDASPAVGNIFAGFRKYGKFMGAFWLLAVVILFCALPALVAVLLVAASPWGDRAASAIALTGGLASVVILIAAAMRWAFVFFLLADEENLGVIAAFNKSVELTKGWRGKLFDMLWVMSLFIICGLLLLIVGVFVTVPITGIGFAWLYIEAKRQRWGTQPGLAPPPVTSPPPSMG
jgi:uncharacterized membrane protein